MKDKRRKTQKGKFAHILYVKTDTHKHIWVIDEAWTPFYIDSVTTGNTFSKLRSEWNTQKILFSKNDKCWKTFVSLKRIYEPTIVPSFTLIMHLSMPHAVSCQSTGWHPGHRSGSEVMITKLFILEQDFFFSLTELMYSYIEIYL